MGTDLPLAGRVVAVTAERRAEEQAGLLARRGAHVVLAPTVHTVDLTADDDLRARTEQVIAAPPDWLVATTGFGMRLWFEAADSWGLGDDLAAALGRARVVARGTKAQSACRQRGLEVVWRAPDESMAEVVAWLRGQDGIGEASVALQLFDPGDHPSTSVIAAAAGRVVPVALYRWRLPDDLAPVRDVVRRVADRSVDAVTFTSQPAVRFLFEVAEQEGVLGEVLAAMDDGPVVPVCVGPVCAEPLVEAGVGTAVWPDPYRLVPMVKLVEQVLAGVRFVRVHPSSPDAVAAVRAYVTELDRRFPGGDRRSASARSSACGCHRRPAATGWGAPCSPSSSDGARSSATARCGSTPTARSPRRSRSTRPRATGRSTGTTTTPTPSGSSRSAWPAIRRASRRRSRRSRRGSRPGCPPTRRTCARRRSDAR
jgi:uroporphyrinogen-III synthase